jgi:hypothetical protein
MRNSLMTSINYRLTYIFSIIGIILGCFLIIFTPAKIQGTSLLSIDKALGPMIYSEPFLLNAEKFSCAPGLFIKLDRKKNRNLKIIFFENDLAKLRIVANSKKEAECFIEAIVDSIKNYINIESKRISININKIQSEIDLLRPKIEKYDRYVLSTSQSHIYDSNIIEAFKTFLLTGSTDNALFLSLINSYYDKQSLKQEKQPYYGESYLESLITQKQIFTSKLNKLNNSSSIKVFPIAYQSYSPIIYRVVIILFVGLIGFLIGIYLSYRKINQ